ncbi:hypothetical protein WA158_006761 [Blastocystis sp. Blastoise]
MDCGDIHTLMHFNNVTLSEIYPGKITTLHSGSSVLNEVIQGGSLFFEALLNGKSTGKPKELNLCEESHFDFFFKTGFVHSYGHLCPTNSTWTDTIIDIKLPSFIPPGKYILISRGVTLEGKDAFCLKMNWVY